MNAYHKEQIDALRLVDSYLVNLSTFERRALDESIAEYLAFRHEVDLHLHRYFGEIFTQTCYRSRLSACCSREGIITFFGDVVVNRLVSTDDEVDKLLTVLGNPNDGFIVLALLAQGITNKEIATALVITTNTVKRHLKSIFAKLDVHTRSAATAKAIGLATL